MVFCQHRVSGSFNLKTRKTLKQCKSSPICDFLQDCALTNVAQLLCNQDEIYTKLRAKETMKTNPEPKLKMDPATQDKSCSCRTTLTSDLLTHWAADSYNHRKPHKKVFFGVLSVPRKGKNTTTAMRTNWHSQFVSCASNFNIHTWDALQRIVSQAGDTLYKALKMILRICKAVLLSIAPT